MEKTVSEYEKKVLQVKTRGLNGCKMFSKYRDQIFGMAALGVIAVHGKTAAYNSPILRKLFEYGGAGVYLFALLSGMGLYFSMTKEKIISGGFGGGGKNCWILSTPFCTYDYSVWNDWRIMVWYKVPTD